MGEVGGRVDSTGLYRHRVGEGSAKGLCKLRHWSETLTLSGVEMSGFVGKRMTLFQRMFLFARLTEHP